MEQRPARKRWLEAIAQNLVANAIWFGAPLIWLVLALWLARDGGNTLTVRVWWLIVAGTVAVVLLVWLLALTISLRSVSRRARAQTHEVRGPGTDATHPYRALLDQIDSLDDILRLRTDAPVEWQLAEIYNSVLAEARAMSPRISRAPLREATRHPMHQDLAAQGVSALLASLRQIRAIVNAAGLEERRVTPG